jgi:hypothetical protein
MVHRRIAQSAFYYSYKIMVGWLTALLFALIMVATIKAREHEKFDVVAPNGDGYFTSISEDYQTLLDAYSTAFVASKKTGDQTAVIQVQSAIEAYQVAMRDQVQQNQFYIQTFLDEYKDSNPELEALHEKAQTLKEEGPKIANELAVSSVDTPPQIDYGALITRVVVLSLIIGISVALSA